VDLPLSVTPEIVLGPPGTGKTTTLIGIVEECIADGTPPERIGYISFTKRAAHEAMERALLKFTGLGRTDFPYFRTIHSLCFSLMGMSSSMILTGRRLEEFGEQIGYKITGRFSLEDGTIFGFERGDRLLFMENLARIRQVPLRQVYDEDDDELSFHEVDRFARGLAAYKEEHGVVDFTDMLARFVDSGSVPELDILLVDEAQDLSHLQWQVVWKLARSVRRLVIAGDDDQAIYRWAGADVDTFIGLEGTTRVLDQSWRVPRAVQAVADDVIRRVRKRRSKIWKARDTEGAVRYVGSTGSIDLSGRDILVLGRNRYVLREFESTIRSAGYLYEFQGARSIRPSLLSSVVTWERLRRSPDGVLASDCKKMYDLMSVGRGVARGSKTLPRFTDEETVYFQDLVDRGGLLLGKDVLWYDALDKMSQTDVAYIRAALRRGEDLRADPRIRLSTIHGVKGGQADEVVLLTDMAQRTFEEARRNPEDEARVWYVAVTRAREKLHIVAPKTSRHYQL